jgi:hypothetical protein
MLNRLFGILHATIARNVEVTSVPYYRLYFVGDEGHFTSAEELERDSDQEAIEAARRLARNNNVELWNGGRRVAIINDERTLMT